MPDAMNNSEVVRALRELALQLAEQRNTFQAHGLTRALDSIEALERPIVELWLAGGLPALSALPWVGRPVAVWLVELLSLGKIAATERPENTRS